VLRSSLFACSCEDDGAAVLRSSSFPRGDSRAGMMRTSTSVLHVTHLEAGCQTSTCVSQLTDRGGFLSGPDGRTELRRKRDERRDAVLVLVLVLRGRRGFGGICRNNDTGAMLYGVVGSFQRAGRFRLVL